MQDMRNLKTVRSSITGRVQLVVDREETGAAELKSQHIPECSRLTTDDDSDLHGLESVLQAASAVTLRQYGPAVPRD
jgi:hypothetical protein